MKLMYSFGGGEKPRCYLDAEVAYVTPGTLIIRSGVRIPTLSLQYDLQSLGPISAIIGSMSKRGEFPEIYIWDEDKEEPEVAISFGTMRPGKGVLDAIAGKAGEVVNEAAVRYGCDRVFTVAQVNLMRIDIVKLLRELDESHAYVIVNVHEMGANIISDEPMYRFTRSIVRRERLSTPL